jgi:uncharacterized protein YchJ
MSEQAKALVQKLVEAGEWPEPALLDEILAQGQEAVEPLLEVVRSQPHGWPAEAPLDHAIVLLCTLRPPEALPPLIDLLRHYSNEMTETVAANLPAYGPAVIDPALAVVRDADLTWFSRSAAAELAIRAAGKDQGLRAHVAAGLRETLAAQLAKAPEYVSRAAADEEAKRRATEEELDEEYVAPPGSADDYYQANSCLVMHLSMLADPQARELIRQAYKADIIDPWMIRKEQVEQDYRVGGDFPRVTTLREALDRYRADYEEHLAKERRTPLSLHSTPAQPPARRGDYEPVPQPIVNEERQPGRNEPCWCGSGKKYKHCHMREDRK